MRHIRRYGSAGLCLALLAFVVGAGVPGGQTLAQDARGTLVYGLGGEPKLLDTGDSSDNNASIVQAQIYNSLVGNKPGTMEFVPDLALSWTPSENYTVWTFQLRPGVKFQDGTPFNADAVKFNVERWWDPESPYSFMNAGRTHATWRINMGPFRGQAGSVLKDVTVAGPYTVKFTTTVPFPDLPAVLAGDGHFGIASPTAVRTAGPKYGSPSAFPVGTGPFIVKSWTSGDRIVLARNPGYWKSGLPKADALVVKFVSDPAAQLADLQAGTLDFTSNLLPEQLKTMRGDAHLRPIFAPTTNVGYLNLNPTYAPLAKPDVRRAIAMAIDQKGIVSALLGPELAVSNGHVTPPVMSWAWSSKITSYPYDPARAKSMLAEAGYPNGFALDLWYMPVPRPYMPVPKSTAESIAANLSVVGLRIRLQTEDWAAYQTDLENAKLQSSLYGTVESLNPGVAYFVRFTPGSTHDLGGWTDPKVMALLNEARQTGDRAVQVKDYSQIDELLFNDAVRIPLAHTKVLAGERTVVSGWTPSPFGSESWEDISKSAP